MNKLVQIGVAFLFAACNTTQDHNRSTMNVDLTTASDLQEFKLSDFGNAVQYVPLETNESCLIGDNPQISLLEDKIVVTTKDQCLLFNKQTGKYIGSIGHIGDDPSGYSATNFWIDDAGTFYFFRAPDQLLKYNQKGVMTGKIKIPTTPAAPDCFAFADSTIIAHCNGIMGRKTDNSLLFLNSSGEKQDSIRCLLKSTPVVSPEDIAGISIFKKGAEHYGNMGRKGAVIIRDKEQSELVLPMNAPTLWTYENEVRFRESFIDTVYTLRNKEMHPYIVFQTNHSSADAPWYNNPESIRVAYVLENEHSVFFQYIKDKKVYNGLLDKATNQTKFDKCRQFIADDLTKGQELKVDLSALCSYKGEYAFILENSSIEAESPETQPDSKKDNVPEWLSQLDDDANPVIAIVSFSDLLTKK